MKAAIVCFALVASALAVVNPIYAEWEKWKNEYKPNYLTNEEHDRRFNVFAENKHKVLELNKKYADDVNGPRFALNKFADLTSEEFASMYLHAIPSDTPRSEPLPASVYSRKDYPKKKDWRDEGAVNPVKDQGMCSCWPFSAAGNMEGVYKAAHGELPVVSMQQLIDCDHDCMIYHGVQRCNDGCETGLMPNAMSYAVREGMTSEKAYPYTGANGTCKYDPKTMTPIYHFSKWFQVNSNEDDMVAALNDVGPLSVGVDATEWQLYSGGIFNAKCGTMMNHGVVLVGYDSVTVSGKEVQFWILKNSWGSIWGENGYIRLVRGCDECGVNDFVNTVVA